ncbi:IclR family transcriptional regulator [Diaminobutyricibacter sp. McL0618]|uniref:IclR family transcriptional regulator n=1 Tax=Leifsonia sp. McL0618 TaxID=3415677 RepID=UPI003CF39443
MGTDKRMRSDSNQSVERAAAVLGAFTTGLELLRVADVAALAGIGQSTASRLLATLEQLEYVERDAQTGLYGLGPAVVTLGGIAVNHLAVHREARQRAQDLAHTLGLGVNVAIRSGNSIFYVCNFEGVNAPRSYTLVGQRNPLHATGIGKCLLLGLDAPERRKLLPELEQFTPATIADHDRLDAELAAIGSNGYATEREELALARSCVAAPIRDRTRQIVAALSISGPLSTIDLDHREKELSKIAIEAADSISVGLGYPGPAHAAYGSVMNGR